MTVRFSLLIFGRTADAATGSTAPSRLAVAPMKIRTVGVLAASVSATSAPAAVGWRALVLLVIVVGSVLATAVWVLADDQRTRRLAILLGRHRGDDVPPTV
jgi:predicted secreted protein